MKFGPVAIEAAAGCILAHGVRLGDGLFKKGRMLSSEDVAALQAAGVSRVTVAQLEDGDVAEDLAARALALTAAGEGVLAQQAFTGRANVHAKGLGLAVIDGERVRAINHIDESLTVATLAPYALVSERQMVATIKVIPFATPQAVLAKALAIVGDRPLVQVKSFVKQRVALIITTLAQTKASIITKTEEVTRARLAALGLALAAVETVPHTDDHVRDAIARQTAAGSDLVLVFGASAIVDRADVIPAAVVGAGGRVVHLGMPVDPGNLLMLGDVGGVPVIGVPSCARSPKRNGFDWVLERLCAGVAVSREDLMDMGAGGLLAEIPSRPSPRELQVPSAPKVVAVVLAAGEGKRMGGGKMLKDFGGRPMIAATVANVLASGVDEVVVVTGLGAADVGAAVKGPPQSFGQLPQRVGGARLRVVHNPDYASGMASSLRVGVQAAGVADAVVVCLGDMPRVSGEVIDRLIAAFNPIEHRSIVVPTHKGQFGNPVLWGAEHFARLTSLQGDKGARALIAGLKAEATEVDADEGVLMDFDTVEALEGTPSVTS